MFLGLFRLEPRYGLCEMSSASKDLPSWEYASSIIE